MRSLEPHQKVFGLGLSKTGTSSLAAALNRLGVPSLHYPSDERTYRELRNGCYRLSVAEEYQGLVDIPVAPFYVQLDQVYPRSKFVLTIREKTSWLRSTELHWRLMMDWWDRFPDFKRFQEFISAVTYGTVAYNADRFSLAYDTHVRNVQEHFRERPDDLIVLDICGGDGWEPLCAFLGRPVPDEPFPRENEWMHLLLEAAREIESVVPRGETFILVDEEGFGREFAGSRACLPFLERDGQYWGRPAHDAQAISELERLRAAGARWLVFGWPAFWWLECYSGFAGHVRDRYDCVFESGRLIAFDLREHSRRGAQRPHG